MTVADLLAIPPAEPVSPSTAWREIIEPAEQALFEGFAREIMAWQKSDAPARGPLRGGASPGRSSGGAGSAGR